MRVQTMDCFKPGKRTALQIMHALFCKGSSGLQGDRPALSLSVRKFGIQIYFAHTSCISWYCISLCCQTIICDATSHTAVCTGSYLNCLHGLKTAACISQHRGQHCEVFSAQSRLSAFLHHPVPDMVLGAISRLSQLVCVPK